jgi:protein-S-isoprenylcysteine O-methyltransferase Ste14
VATRGPCDSHQIHVCELYTQRRMPVRSRPATTARSQNLVKMVLQTASLWVIFLGVIPSAITRLEGAYPQLPKFDSAPFQLLAIVVFCLCGALGFWCGYLLVALGRGTPFPWDCTNRFVVAGPYRVVRNPMAALGITQGVMVGLYLGSWTIIAYSLMGALVWNVFARPWEERDMAERFGDEYVRYCSSVRCWLPRLRPYTQPVESSTRSAYS